MYTEKIKALKKKIFFIKILKIIDVISFIFMFFIHNKYYICDLIFTLFLIIVFFCLLNIKDIFETQLEKIENYYKDFCNKYVSLTNLYYKNLSLKQELLNESNFNHKIIIEEIESTIKNFIFTLPKDINEDCEQKIFSLMKNYNETLTLLINEKNKINQKSIKVLFPNIDNAISLVKNINDDIKNLKL